MNARDIRVLLVEDDPAQRDELAGFLEDLGFEVQATGDGQEAVAALRRGGFDLVISDVRMPGISGLQLLKEARDLDPEIPVILVTAFGTIPDAVACLKDGGSDYLLKPLNLDQVEHSISRALETRRLQREVADLRRRLGELETIPGIVTSGGPMAEVLSTIARAARSQVSVLILGESGTGKELLARALHEASPRAGGPFVTVNAAALSPSLLESELFGHEKGAFTGADRSRKGRFETAGGGTLFLDEVGDLAPEVQVKLLRVIQERVIERVGSNQPIPVDVRIVAATHRDLPAEVKAGRFREDLFYRLAVVIVEVPALRHRRADIPLLVEHLLEKHLGLGGGGQKQFSREALDRLVRYDFPGNVRELENIVQRALVLSRGDLITAADLPSSVQRRRDDPSVESPEAGDDREDRTLPEAVLALERAMIESALAAEKGNQTRAAERLGISERTLRYKMGKWRSA